MLKHIPLRASCFLLGALIGLIIRFVQMLLDGKVVGEADSPPENRAEMAD